MRDDLAPQPPPYHAVEPCAPLRGIVRQLWRFEALAEEARVERIPADGCAELIVHIGTPYREIGPKGPDSLQPRVLFAGQLTKPLAIVAAGEVATLGVRFEPTGARAFLGAPMDKTTDRRIDFADIDPAGARDLWRAASGSRDWETRFALTEAYVLRRIETLAVGDDPLVGAAVRDIMRSRMIDPAGVSERQLQRRFKDRVGVSPRMLQSIFRFRRVFEEIESGAPDWLSAALAAGYFDQPQMARDFRRFLGCTATEWASEKAGLSASLAAETYKPPAAAGR